MLKTLQCLACLFALVVIAGCNPPAETGGGDAGTGDTSTDASDDADGGDVSSIEGIDETVLASFSAEDKAAIIAQEICPVGGHSLTGMGEPVAVDVNGRKVWICCEGCEEALKENPEEYLAKLDGEAEEDDSDEEAEAS